MQTKFSLADLFQIFDKDTIRHLRIPFSVYLLPIYMYSLSMTQDVNLYNALIIFICLHLFIYPASNSYNSYMDKDEGSIGGLKSPPAVTRKLYFASIFCDLLGLALALFIGIELFWAIGIYIAVSKLYSWNKIRLKKYGILSWLIVMLFQGGYTYFLVGYFSSYHSNQDWFNTYNLSVMLIASLFVGAFYPLSQIYQHQEDNKRGDKTISIMLGIKGTFILSLCLFGIVNLLLLLFFLSFFSFFYYLLFFIFLFPVAIYFLKWMRDSFNNPNHASFERTMKLNNISALCMSSCFLIILLSANQ